MWQVPTRIELPGTDNINLYNPFVCILGIVRNPILNEPLDIVFITKALVISAVVILVSLFSFARLRGRIAFWV